MNLTIAYHLSTTQDGGVPLSAFPKDTTSKLAGFVFTSSFMVSAKQEAVNTNFLESLGPGIELRVYRHTNSSFDNFAFILYFFVFFFFSCNRARVLAQHHLVVCKVNK